MVTADLSTMGINSHAGAVVRNGGLRALLKAHRPDRAVVLEVTNLADVARAKAGLGYSMAPARSSGQTGVVILTRRRTIRRGATWNPRLTAHRDRMHPERRRTTVASTHKKTGRQLVDYGVHLWAMGDGWASPEDVVRQHVAQMRAFVDEASAQPRDVLVFLTGDYNEDLDDRDDHGGRAAVSIAGDAGITFAHRRAGQHGSTSLKGRSLLDDVAYRSSPTCELVSRRTLRIPGRGDDHLAVLTTHRIRSLT